MKEAAQAEAKALAEAECASGSKNSKDGEQTKNTAIDNTPREQRKRRYEAIYDRERKKRKDIIRLDDLEQSTLALPERRAPPTPLKIVPPSYLATKKRMSNAKKRKRPRRIVASNIDGWMPNVDDLLKFPTNSNSISETRDVEQQQQQSSIVRLHGLPMGVKPEQIRKFFHGLNPDLIFALPTFSHPIQGWDAADTTLPSDKTMECNNVDDDNNPRPQYIAKRHPSTFRVFVKFTSFPVANAAIERTGEPIEFEKEGYDDKKCGESSNGKVTSATNIVGASISISPVSKQDASFLQKHMAIYTKKGEAIVATVKRTEEQIGPVVTQLIWQMAIKKLSLSHRLGGKGTITSDNDYIVPTNEVQYQTLAKLYNNLIDIHEKLELDPGIMFTHAFDPTIDDSTHKITQSVSNWLLDRVSTMGRLLNESRQWLKLGMTRNKLEISPKSIVL